MKTTLFFAAAFALLASCTLLDSLSGETEKSNLCQIVNADQVPQVVKDSLAAHFPGVTPIKWLNKDNTGYCVNFIASDTKDIIALFSNVGNFVSQEENTQTEQTGDHADNGPDTAGCHCEIEGSGK